MEGRERGGEGAGAAGAFGVLAEEVAGGRTRLHSLRGAAAILQERGAGEQ